jgi:Caspase domain/YARHG domain
MNSGFIRCRVHLLLLVLLALGTSPVAQAQGRFAFVVGNDAYDGLEPLKKAVNDARSIAASLRKIGFEVTLGENLTRRNFVAKFGEFENRIQPGDYAFLFYSGHGVELEGANYLIPVDLPKVAANQQSVLKDEGISTDNLIQRLKARGTRAQVLVLDACRENPFRDTKGRSVGGRRGLAPIQAPGGVFVIYSAGVGEAALDRLSDNDADPNSVFTRSFIPLLENANMPLVAVAKETRAKVKSLAGTIGQIQSPAYYDEVDGDLFLARLGGNFSTPAPPIVLPPAPVAPPITRIDPVPPPPPVVANVQPAARSGLIFADSDRRHLTRDELVRLSPEQLRLARNEIYARRGRFFRDATLAAHFARFSWYKPFAWDVPLNPVEKANINLIQSMER